MNHFATSRDGEQSQNASVAGTYDPYASSYSADLDSMLAAHNASVGHNLSPSGSFTSHMSPETMLSESAYGGVGPYSHSDMGNTDEHMTRKQFEEMLRLSDNAAFNLSSTDNFQHPSHSLNIPQTQSSVWSQASQDGSTSVMPSMEGQYTGSNTALARQISPQHLSPSQGSPAGSSSSRPFISPIVRVESYEETLQPSRMFHNADLSGRQLSHHLSPYDAPDFESEGGPERRWQHDDAFGSVSTMQRHEDGSWVGDAAGQKGLSPHTRSNMKDIEGPTLDELQEQRQLAEKNADVQDWLARSEVGSEADETHNTSLSPYTKPNSRRRAKSTNDLGKFHMPDDSYIPGPGAYLNVQSDYDEEEDNLSTSDGPDSPPAEVQVQNQESYFSSLSEDSLNSGPVPWADPPTHAGTSEKTYQPPTANAAMMRFKQRAKDIESASLAATLGSSRRRSESDIESVLTAKGVSRDLSAQTKEKPHRMESLISRITTRRNPNNQHKRKNVMTGGQSQLNLSEVDSGSSTPNDPQPAISTPMRIGSWGKPKSPMLDTSPSMIGSSGTNGNNLTVTSPATPWGMAKSVIRRRSRSDLGRSRSKSDSGRSPGLGELMTQFGGPPMLNLASPSGAPQDKQASSNGAIDADDDSGDEGGALSAGITMDLAVRSDPVIPTFQGFHTQARHLNPRIPEYLLERIAKEQVTRYQRLLAAKGKHIAATEAKNCPSKGYCLKLGGASQPLKPRVGNKEADSPFQGFQIIKPGMSGEEIEKDSDGTIIAAQFPSGVPLPPVDRLPAEFECPLCFKVKKFWKPSDWTKHVHEDVQPFTCTFRECTEPKSFKRKADWVRHENERHRQLENWTCNIGECIHTCYRKDNFVQHLVREHKIPEPKARVGKGGPTPTRSPISPISSRTYIDPYTAMANPSNYGADDIWSLVERCRQDTTKQPHNEPCKFCGNICNSWKKLTVHLAKHMEQISMPILPLIEAKLVTGAMETTPFEAPLVPSNAAPLTDSPQHLPTFLTDEPLPLELNEMPSQTSITPGISVNGAQVMHTFPPPQYLTPQYQATVSTSSYGALPPDTSFSNRSYPGPMRAVRQHTPSGHSSYSSSVQGSSFLPQRSMVGTYQQQQQQQQQQSAPFAQHQMYQSPAESNGFSDDPMSAVDTNYMMSSGQVSASHSPVPNIPSNMQQNAQFHSGVDQSFNFPSQHYSAYQFGGTSG